MSNYPKLDPTTPEYPPQGWMVEDRLVLPPSAFGTRADWLTHVKIMFPDMASRMEVIKVRDNWSDEAEVEYWFDPCVRWLNRKGTPK